MRSGAKRVHNFRPDLQIPVQLQLYTKSQIQANDHHVLQQLLPSPTSHTHGLRSRRHSYTLHIMIVILLLGCYTRTYINCLVNPFFSYFIHFISCILTTFH